MKSPARKGQGAIEYLTTYGWVIIVVAVSVLILWQLGIFTPPQPKRGSLGFSQVVPVDWVVSTSNLVYLQVQSEAGDSLVIGSGDINITIGEVTCTDIPASDISMYPLTIQPGKSKRITVECSSTPSVGSRFVVGEYYEAQTRIKYRNVKSDSSHESVGKIFGPIEGPTPQATLPVESTTTTAPPSTSTTSPTSTTTTIIGDRSPRCFINVHSSTGSAIVAVNDSIYIDVNGTDDYGVEWIKVSYSNDTSVGLTNPSLIQWWDTHACGGVDEIPETPEFDCLNQWVDADGEQVTGIYYYYAMAREDPVKGMMLHRESPICFDSIQVKYGYLSVELAYPKPGSVVGFS